MFMKKVSKAEVKNLQSCIKPLSKDAHQYFILIYIALSILCFHMQMFLLSQGNNHTPFAMVFM